MSIRRFIILLIAALAVIAGAMYLSSQRYLDRDPRGGALLVNLNSRIDAITHILIRNSAQPQVALDRAAPGVWTVAQRADYPADVSKVRRLLLALSDATIAEQKTSLPANYAAIGVEDPTKAAGGIEVSLVSPNGTSAVIVGHASGNGSFARRSGEARSYLIEPAITVDASPRDWIETKLLDIAPEKIRAVDVKFADGSAYSISRKSAKQPGDKPTEPPKDADFTLDKIPSGREAADPSSIGPSPTTYSGVTADDVGQAKDIDFAKHASVQVSLFDGGHYTITGAVLGDKHWVSIDAPADAAVSAKAKNRAFEIAGYRYDAIFRPLEQLLKPKPEKPKSAGAKTVKKP